jgi:hypothetical protein
MDHGDRELEQAREELTFWRDYATWWSSETGNPPQPRIAEALDRAERRYASAVLLYNLRGVM